MNYTMNTNSLQRGKTRNEVGEIIELGKFNGSAVEGSGQKNLNQPNEYLIKGSNKEPFKSINISPLQGEVYAAHLVNNGEIWSDQENSKLVFLWGQGNSSIKISQTLKRSAQAIRSQLWKLKVSETRLQMELLDRKRRGLPIRMTTKPNDPRLIKLSKESFLPEKPWAQGKKWTSTLDTELAKDWESGMELLPIVTKYGRTPIAIFARLCLLGELSEELNPYRVNSKDGEIEDQVITKLKKLTNFDGNFSYLDIRKIAKRDCGLWGKLNSGTAILDTQDKLDQYWFSYGLMIESQWKYVFKNFKVDSFDDGVEIIDYGCGQGGASLLFLDEYYSDFKNDISKIKLIEQSSLALKRAKSTLECYSSDIQIVDINKKLDDLETKDLETDQNRSKVHLFSNVLDIDSFDIFKLLNKIIKSKGNHSFVAVSHDRDFKGGSRRLKDIYEFLTDPKKDLLKINYCSDVKKFKCNHDKMSAIGFKIDLEVLG